MSSNEIFSSTGNLGTAIRQDERLYTNQGFTNDFDAIKEQFLGNVERMRTKPDSISRAVFRALVGDEARVAVLESPELQADVEVLLPLSTGQSLMYLGRNAPHRSGGPAIAELVEATSSYNSRSVSPVEQIRHAAHRGYEWSDAVAADDIFSLQDLWGATFGWDKSEVMALQARLEDEAAGAPTDRSAWVSLARYDGHVVAAAMAERLTLPGRDGPVPVVESTEWRVDPRHQRRANLDDPDFPRLMEGALSILDAQVWRDLDSPLIMAECNLRSRADRVGNKAGFVVPERALGRHTISQILRNNVTVQDGLGRPGGPLPNFVFMHRPNDAASREESELLLVSAGLER